MKISYHIYLLIISFFLWNCHAVNNEEKYDQLKIDFSGDAKIEVGSPFVGVEFHHSSPIPQRISFFYPVANSIDVSTDYWHRDTTFIMAVGLKFGNMVKEWLGKEPYTYTLTPYQVIFNKVDDQMTIEISYQFTQNQPAMVTTYKITNRTNSIQNIEFDTHLETSLRTCHTFTRKKEAWTEYDPNTSTIYIHHADSETQNAQIFLTNAGQKPAYYNTKGPLKNFLPLEKKQWEFISPLIPQEMPSETAARFFYEAELEPGKSLEVVQLIGSSGQEEGYKIVSDLISNFREERTLYENHILNETFNDTLILLNDPEIMHSMYWARAILAVNKHYLDGEIVPMPCPAEYNFYFTHDALVTDLAAVNFDLKRVKKDLDYIIKHANSEKVIPHAYYWKDSTYVTEFASSDNWNNFWMIIATATYFRHSSDSSFVQSIYPYLEKCLEIALRNKKEDNLMWSYQPDWWDIGENYGPRSYMTILAIKAIRDYIYISSILKLNSNELPQYEIMADLMQDALNDILWNDDLKYLVNYYEDKSLDAHYYIGSLLAAHYKLINKDRLTDLVHSAKQHLLDEKIGIYNAFPMDFHTLVDYLKFSGNEAGDTNYYFNGGIWPQGNAWYALALIADNSKEEAYQFIKNVMTLEGIMAGPNGQPAMYEVRNSNKSNPVPYGSVDKPQFMWAGAWYLYCLYHLYCLEENHWNLSLSPYMDMEPKKYHYNVFTYGQKLSVEVEGEGKRIAKIMYQERLYPSRIISLNNAPSGEVKVYLGQPVYPYLYTSNSTLINCDYNENEKKLKLNLIAFSGHKNYTTIITPFIAKSVLCDGADITKDVQVVEKESIWELSINSIHKAPVKEIEIVFF